MNIQEFAQRYGVSGSSIMSNRATGYLPDAAFYTLNRNSILQVKEEYFIRRWDLIERVKYDNQELFYLITEHISADELSRTIQKLYGGNAHSIGMYFCRGLFSLNDENVMKVGNIAWKVWRYFRAVERRLKRRGTSMSKILDKRMERAA